MYDFHVVMTRNVTLHGMTAVFTAPFRASLKATGARDGGLSGHPWGGGHEFGDGHRTLRPTNDGRYKYAYIYYNIIYILIIIMIIIITTIITCVYIYIL